MGLEHYLYRAPSMVLIVLITLFLLAASPSQSAVKRMVKTKRSNSSEQNDLVVVLMVKNEAGPNNLGQPIIQATLQPLIESGMKKFFIFDTGSTDFTIPLSHAIFKKYRITHYVIKQEPFIDFATSRNRALTLAEKHFPQTHFMLMLDAEWYLHNGKELLSFCKKQTNSPHASYAIRIQSPFTSFYSQRLIRCRSDARFAGSIHEVIVPATREKVPDTIYFTLGSSRYGIKKSQERWIRDLELLKSEHAKNPYSTRTLFYLAQTYGCLQDWRRAALYYKLRMHLNPFGWPEENFITIYRLAQLTEERSYREQKDYWPQALEYYLQAFQLRPTRAEPLIRIAQHYYRNSNMHLCYFFAQQATELAYPKNDVLFIEKFLYDYERYFLLGLSAYKTGHYKIGEQALRTLFKSYPQSFGTHRLLHCSLSHKEKIKKTKAALMSNADLSTTAYKDK